MHKITLKITKYPSKEKDMIDILDETEKKFSVILRPSFGKLELFGKDERSVSRARKELQRAFAIVGGMLKLK